MSVLGEPGDTAEGAFANEQEFAYRRGFVLGLTLAETALLLIFVLLLLLVVGFERREKLIVALTNENHVFLELLPRGVPLDTLERDLLLLAELKEVGLTANEQWDEKFLELIRSAASASQEDGVVDLVSSLAEERAHFRKLVDALSDVNTSEDVMELATQVLDMEALLKNQRGQINDLMGQLSNRGGGGVLPSCWTNADGKADYLLDVVLDGRGIRARETHSEARRQQRGRLPMAVVDSSAVYSKADFMLLTRALFDWSVERECRFYVTVYDETGSDAKEQYKALMQTVEAHFYKRQSLGAAPF